MAAKKKITAKKPQDQQAKKESKAIAAKKMSGKKEIAGKKIDEKSDKLSRKSARKTNKQKTVKIKRASAKKTRSKHSGIVIVNKGIEDIAASEIKELIGAKPDIREGAVIFPIKDFEDLCILSYKGQSFSRVMLLLQEFSTSEHEPEKIIENIDADFQIAEELVRKEDIRFAARSARIGEHEYQKQELERALGEKIHYTYKNVDLAQPNITFYCHSINSQFYLGIDFSGEIDKREYRIYTTPKELKATIAYALIRIAGYDGKKAILDPFSGSATIPIESALYAAGMSPRFFKKNNLQFTKFDRLRFNFAKHEKKKAAKNISSSDASLHNLKSAEKNSKIASINKSINVSRIDIEWLDTKFDEHELDIIATWPIETAKDQEVKDVMKIYKEFFYQAEYILKKKCRIILVAKKPESIAALKDAAKVYFKTTHERQVMQGKETLNVLVFERK